MLFQMDPLSYNRVPALVSCRQHVMCHSSMHAVMRRVDIDCIGMHWSDMARWSSFVGSFRHDQPIALPYNECMSFWFVYTTHVPCWNTLSVLQKSHEPPSNQHLARLLLFWSSCMVLTGVANGWSVCGSDSFHGVQHCFADTHGTISGEETKSPSALGRTWP